MTSILDIDVSSTGTPGVYKLQVVESPGGQAAATFQLETSDFIERLEDFERTLIASSVATRRILGRGEESVRGVGQRLFAALFSPQSIAGVYRASCAVAVERGETLRMVLRIHAPELAALPWESMFDESANSYVCRREPLVRCLPVASAPPPLRVEQPLKILAVIASPRGLAPLDVEKEKDDLTRALAQPMERGAISLHWLERTTWSALQDALLTESWHIVHFVGHGDFDVERDEGVLALESEEGRVHRVGAESFVDLLREAQPMPRLVVLNACQSSTSARGDLFAGTAAALVRGGVSAVTAMQFGISDKAAIAFCRGFYAAIARGRGIDEAVRSGRVGILSLGDACLEWITPTLYLRGQEAHLFDVSSSSMTEVMGPVQDERRSQAEAASDSGDVASAVPLYDNVLAENPDDVEALRARERTLAESRPTSPAADAVIDHSEPGGSSTEAPERLDVTELDQGEPAAMALYNRGVELVGLGRPEEAIAVFDDVVARYGTAGELVLREQAAKALLYLGTTLDGLGRAEQEIAVYDNLVARYGTADELVLREHVAKALVYKGITLHRLGRAEQEIAVYDEVVARYGTAAEVVLHEQVASALFYKGTTLGKLGRAEQAIGAFDQVVARYGTAGELVLSEPAAKALYNRGVELVGLGRPEEAIAVFDDVVARYGTAGELVLREQAAKALLYLGTTLDGLGRAEQEIAVYDNLVARYGTADELVLREHVAKALVYKGITLHRLGLTEQEIAAYDEVVARYGTAAEVVLHEQVASALSYKATTLGKSGRTKQSMSARYAAAAQPVLREYVAKALHNKKNPWDGRGRQ